MPQKIESQMVKVAEPVFAARPADEVCWVSR